jgi:GntR family transcriptional regulator
VVTDVYIDQRLRERISKEALRTRTSMRLITEVAGVAVKDARQTLTIGTADSETADLLGIPLNAPVAIVHRSAVDETGCLVFVGIGVYRGDVVRVDVQLK